MKANGFGIGLLATLVRAGLAVATPGVVQAGGRTLGVVRLVIMEMGRATVGRDRGSVPAVLVSMARHGSGIESSE